MKKSRASGLYREHSQIHSYYVSSNIQKKNRKREVILFFSVFLDNTFLKLKKNCQRSQKIAQNNVAYYRFRFYNKII